MNKLILSSMVFFGSAQAFATNVWVALGHLGMQDLQQCEASMVGACTQSGQMCQTAEGLVLFCQSIKDGLVVAATEQDGNSDGTDDEPPPTLRGTFGPDGSGDDMFTCTGNQNCSRNLITETERARRQEGLPGIPYDPYDPNSPKPLPEGCRVGETTCDEVEEVFPWSNQGT